MLCRDGLDFMSTATRRAGNLIPAAAIREPTFRGLYKDSAYHTSRHFYMSLD